ncbi:DMT family transporter [Rhizobium rosettiformans]|uniref:DMT family transporter n=1 Tax=Rhizobium rosettiformans TaxID=1368430 RepID=UPI002856CE05|nr:DMT family transporter [Rhizobium rosettiformans]MDR7026989.1 drug/metabolite transporter (DMT)-like permease [Rhizobium rosettiformans]MDR7065110.1 drug/metabolite transporter (DMT)-like permease [Rhizobium rosettiformans]
MSPRDFAAYAYLSLAWGLSFLLLLHVVDAFGWIGAVTFRCFIAGVLLLAIAKIMRRRLDFSAGWLPFAAVGATTVAGQLIGLSYATPLIGTAMAAIFVASIPLFSMVIAQLWGLERITPARVLGLALGTIGIIMLVGFPAVPVTSAFLLGCLAMVGSTFSAAFGSNYASRHLSGTGPWEVTIGSFIAGGVLTLPLLWFVPVPGTPATIDYVYLIALAALMSALTYVLYFGLVKSIGATAAISVEFVVTVVAVLVGAFVLDEPLTALQFCGGAVIVLGCALVLGILRLPRPAA